MHAHAEDLRAEVHDRPDADAFVNQFVRDWRHAGLDDATATLLDFAERVTREAAAVRPADLDELRRGGWDDAAIHDAVQIIAYFNYINRVADALGVELDSCIRRWGE